MSGSSFCCWNTARKGSMYNSIWVPRVTTARNNQTITALASCWKMQWWACFLLFAHIEIITLRIVWKKKTKQQSSLYSCSLTSCPHNFGALIVESEFHRSHILESKREGHQTDWMRHVWVPASSTNPSSFQPAACPQLHLHLLPLLCLLLCPRSAPNPHWDDPEEPAHRLLGGNQPTCQRTHSPQSWGCQVRLVPTLLLVFWCISKPSSQNHPKLLIWQAGGWNHMNIIIVIIDTPPRKKKSTFL